MKCNFVNLVVATPEAMVDAGKNDISVKATKSSAWAYTVDYTQADSFGLDDSDDCGSFCPEAGRRRRLADTSSKSGHPTSAGEDAILHSAAD